MTIGESIRQTRESKGYSRERLSRRSKVSAVAIRNWELNGTMPTLDCLIMVADALNVGLDELVGRRTKIRNESTVL